MPIYATFETTMGTFKVQFYDKEMPYTTAAISNLVETKFYDGLTFHRVIKGFMCQFGCPYSKDPTSRRAGTGGPPPNSSFKGLDGKTYQRDSGGNIQDEHKGKISNKPYTLSMANTGAPNSGGSQFFINTAHNSFLDYFTGGQSKHPVFGVVVEGKDVIDKIEGTPTGQGDKPRTPVVVKSATISTK
mmetsp:Transcript_6657/g.16292  ORF Transcript_6657/g.16292 Transcript_6657/m.16292 type:complete len:187 (-) Transcript_6657:213-773(-)